MLHSFGDMSVMPTRPHVICDLTFGDRATDQGALRQTTSANCWAGWLPAVIFAMILLISPLTHAQSDLPPQVQADIIARRVVEAVQAGDRDRILSELDAYRRLERQGIKLPTPLLFLEAKTAGETQDYRRAESALRDFLSVAQRDDPRYQEALTLYERVSTAAKQQAADDSRRQIAANADKAIAQAEAAIQDGRYKDALNIISSNLVPMVVPVHYHPRLLELKQAAIEGNRNAAKEFLDEMEFFDTSQYKFRIPMRRYGDHKFSGRETVFCSAQAAKREVTAKQFELFAKATGTEVSDPAARTGSALNPQFPVVSPNGAALMSHEKAVRLVQWLNAATETPATSGYHVPNLVCWYAAAMVARDLKSEDPLVGVTFGDGYEWTSDCALDDAEVWSNGQFNEIEKGDCNYHEKANAQYLSESGKIDHEFNFPVSDRSLGSALRIFLGSGGFKLSAE